MCDTLEYESVTTRSSTGRVARRDRFKSFAILAFTGSICTLPVTFANGDLKDACWCYGIAVFLFGIGRMAIANESDLPPKVGRRWLMIAVLCALMIECNVAVDRCPHANYLWIAGQEIRLTGTWCGNQRHPQLWGPWSW